MERRIGACEECIQLLIQNEKGGDIMKERKIEVKVTFTEGYERRYTEACLKQIAKRESKKGERVA